MVPLLQGLTEYYLTGKKTQWVPEIESPELLSKTRLQKDCIYYYD